METSSTVCLETQLVHRGLWDELRCFRRTDHWEEGTSALARQGAMQPLALAVNAF